MAKRFYLVCTAVVFNSLDQVLLIRRHQPNYIFGHNKWLLPGGSLEFGEHPENGVQRELLEEVGITASTIRTHPYVYSWLSEDKEEHVIILAYIMGYLGGEINVEQDEETAEGMWIDTDKVKDLSCFPLTEEIINGARSSY
jgi:mutator protein MutT